jgi:hypothetical protein
MTRHPLAQAMELDATKAATETVACEHCGSFETMEIAGKFLCGDCVALAGCSCAGHGDDGN